MRTAKEQREAQRLRQEELATIDPWLPQINAAFSLNVRYRVTVDDVWTRAGLVRDDEVSAAHHVNRLRCLMRKLGFRRSAVNRGGINFSGFARDPF